MHQPHFQWQDRSLEGSCVALTRNYGSEGMGGLERRTNLSFSRSHESRHLLERDAVIELSGSQGNREIRTDAVREYPQ